MSSILTNMSAMSAVTSLQATQASLAQTENEISTGLAVSSAADNAAYYSIATNMRTNVSNLSAVSSSLNLGSSVVSTATSAMTNVTTILQSIQAQLTTASQPGANLDAINTAIKAYAAQLGNTVSTASFNQVNLLDGSQQAAGTAAVKFVAGVTGQGAATSVQTLTVDTTNTNFNGASYVTGSDSAIDGAATDLATLNTAISGLTSTDISTDDAAFKTVFGTGATVSGNTITLGTGTTAASNYAGTGTGATITLAGSSGNFIVGSATAGTGTTAAETGTLGALTSSEAQTFNGALFSVGQISLSSGSDGGTATTSAQIASYIAQVGLALTTANTASETLGAATTNISLQSTYTSALSDSITTGIGSLVDADMNEASTRLSALQTQQQLGVQALSVANQNSQLILKLFQ